MIGLFILLLLEIFGVQAWLLYVLRFSFSITIVGLGRLRVIYKCHCLITFLACIPCILELPFQPKLTSVFKPMSVFFLTLNHFFVTLFGLYKIKSFAIMQPDTTYVGCMFPSIKICLSLFALICITTVFFSILINSDHVQYDQVIVPAFVNMMIYIILYVTSNSLIMHVARSFKKYSDSADSALKFQIKSNLFVVPLLFYTSFLLFTFAIVCTFAKWDLYLTLSAIASILDMWINNIIMNIHTYGFQLMRTMFIDQEDINKHKETRLVALPGLHPVGITRDQIHRNPMLQEYAIFEEKHIRHRCPEYDDHQRRSRYPEQYVDRSFESDDLSRVDFYE